MFAIKGIDHIVLRTNKINEMIHFYCNILSCHIENKQEEIKLTQLRAGDSIIDLIETSEELAEGIRHIEHFCLRITPFNYENLSQYFQQHNIEIYRYGNRYGAQGYGQSFYLKDPEGNEVELKETD